MVNTGQVGQLRTDGDLRRAVRRLQERGITDPDTIVGELMRGRSAGELRVMLGAVWGGLDPAVQRRVLAAVASRRDG